MPQSAIVTSGVLHWPRGEKPPERRGIYYAFSALILGGLVAGCILHPIWVVLGLAAMFGVVAFHQYNGRDTVNALAEQLKQRPSFPADA